MLVERVRGRASRSSIWCCSGEVGEHLVVVDLYIVIERSSRSTFRSKICVGDSDEVYAHSHAF